jgi:16S rRNA (cytosine967-C5)-methyltransferase
VRDASRPLADLAAEAGPFDRVLVDAPCSGLGTLRRNPDARWRVAPGDPARLAELQRTLLRNAATVLKPGGVLVYATCTQLPEENEGVVGAVMADTAGFARPAREALPAPVRDLVDADGFLRCQPHLHDTDGFVAIRLEHRP